MNKVYFDREKNQWFVSEPEDMYLFKSVNTQSNEEEKQILSWTRGFDMTKYPNHIRMYDVEINGVKYFFLMKPEKDVYVIDPRAAKVDPKRSATKIFSDVPTIVGKAESWKIESDFIEIDGWNEPAVAQCIAANLPYGSTLYVSSSRPIRDLEAFAEPRDGVEVFANRGLAGIDGNLSTALGIASKRECTYAVVGDLAFLHDLTALVNQENIKLKLIVINNDGGGIFSTLPQAGVAGFEKIFGTPHGQDLFEIAGAFKLPVTEIDDLKSLKQFMDPPVGFEIGILQMPSREENATLIKELAQRVNYRQ